MEIIIRLSRTFETYGARIDPSIFFPRLATKRGSGKACFRSPNVGGNRRDSDKEWGREAVRSSSSMYFGYQPGRVAVTDEMMRNSDSSILVFVWIKWNTWVGWGGEI